MLHWLAQVAACTASVFDVALQCTVHYMLKLMQQPVAPTGAVPPWAGFIMLVLHCACN